MVLPVGFTVARIASSAGGSYWVAEDTGLAASMTNYGFAVKSNPSADTVYVVISRASGQAGEGGMLYSLDINDPTTENYALRFRGYASGTNDFYLGGTNQGGSNYNGASYGTQNCFFVNDTYLYFLGTYETSSSTDTAHPVLVIANASNGSINSVINFDDEATHDTYPRGGLGGMMGHNNGSLWLHPYRSKSDGSSTKADYGYAKVTGTTYNLFESVTATVTANLTHQMSVPCHMSANGNHGLQISSWNVYTNSNVLSNGLNWATFVENNSRSFAYLNTQGDAQGNINRRGIATCINNSKDAYLAHGTRLQLFKFSDGDYTVTRSSSYDDYQFGSYAKNFTISNSGTIALCSMQLDPSEAYLYLAYACENDNSIIIFKRDASDLSAVSSMRITHSDSGYVPFDDGSYANPKNLTMEVVDDDTLLLGVGAFAKMFVIKIPSDLSTTGTYGNFTFASGDGIYLNSGGSVLTAPVAPNSLSYPRWHWSSSMTQGTSNGSGISGSNKASTGSYQFSTSVDYFDFNPSKTDV